MFGDAGQDVGEARSPPRSEPQNSHDFHPKAIDHLQRLGDVLTEPGQPRPAAAAAGHRSRHDHAFTGQMIRERFAGWPMARERCHGGGGVRDLGRRHFGGEFILCRGFEFLQRQLKLFQKPRGALRARAIAITVQLLDLQLSIGVQIIAGRMTAKARIVEETRAPGAKVTDLAGRNGIVASVVFTWRRQALNRVSTVRDKGRGPFDTIPGCATKRTGPATDEALRKIAAMGQSIAAFDDVIADLDGREQHSQFSLR
jgi:transposase